MSSVPDLGLCSEKNLLLTPLPDELSKCYQCLFVNALGGGGDVYTQVLKVSVLSLESPMVHSMALTEIARMCKFGRFMTPLNETCSLKQPRVVVRGELVPWLGPML